MRSLHTRTDKVLVGFDLPPVAEAVDGSARIAERFPVLVEIAEQYLTSSGAEDTPVVAMMATAPHIDNTVRVQDYLR